MEVLYISAAICSIVGMLFSLIAAIQARSASRAAEAARDAAQVRSLSDELQLACERGEQLVDYLQHDRYSEARLRVDELSWSLSELPFRRGPHLSIEHQNILLTSRQQLQTIVDAIENNKARNDRIDDEQIMLVARQVTMHLREVLGGVRSHIEHGEN